jgi:uncharacterized protein involved in exopolysaccharide biosynthesis
MKQPDKPHKTSLIDLLVTLAREKKFIFTTVFVITLLALVISLLITPTFKSSAVILPVKNQQSLGGLGALAGSMLPLSFDTEVLGPERLAVILSSRTMQEKTIEEFDLMEVYEKTYIEEALQTLESNTEVTLVRDGGFGFNPINAIEISVEDEDPARAQSIAAFYISYLDSVANDMNEINSRERFEIIEKRFLENERDLEEAEEALKAFQEEYGIIDIEAQSQVLIQSLADLVAQRTELDIEINLLRNRVDASNSDLRNLRQARSEVNREIEQLTQAGEREAGFNLIPSTEEVPDLSLRYLRLYRDTIVQNKIYETIYPQYVQQEMLVKSPRRNIQIVDAPQLPTYKDGPKRAFIVLGGFFFSVIISVFIVLFSAYLRGLEKRDDEEFERYTELKQHLQFWKK